MNSCYGPEGLGVHCCFLVEFSSLAAHLAGCFSCMLLSWGSCLAPVWDTPSFKHSSAPDGPPFFILSPSKALLCLLANCLCVLTWVVLSSTGGSITVPTVSARPVVVLASTQQTFRTYELNDEGNKPYVGWASSLSLLACEVWGQGLACVALTCWLSRCPA